MKIRGLVVAFGLMLLAGCAGHAKHSQCQSLKNNAAGAQLGAVLTWEYSAQIKADIDERRYERCEEMFDAVQYQAQLQQEQAQAQAQAQAQEQERKRLLMEKIKGPEMQTLLRKQSLADLVDCEKGVGEGSEKFPPDVKAVVSYECEREIDRRVDTGAVSRNAVNKILNHS